jgi:hypothetical protein
MSDNVGVWSERGIIVAQKQIFTTGAGQSAARRDEHRDDFAAVVSLVRDMDRFIGEGKSIASQYARPSDLRPVASNQQSPESLASIVSRSEELLRRAGHIEHVVSLPDRDLLRQFHNCVGVDRSVKILRDLTQSATERLRSNKLSEENRRMGEVAIIARHLDSKLRWSAAIMAGLVAIQIIDLAASYFSLAGNLRLWAPLLGGPVFLALAAVLLKPWKRKAPAQPASLDLPVWVVSLAMLAFVLAWLVAVFHPSVK